MKMGKISEAVLKRSVIRQISKRREEVLLGAVVGGDCAVLEFSEDEDVVLAANPLTGAGGYIGLPLLHRVANNLAAAGAEPVGVMSTILLPEGFEERELRSLVKQLEETAAALCMEIVGGHTEVAAAVKEPVVSLTGIGKVKRDRRIRTGGSCANQDVVISKWIGIEGTAFLARQREKELRTRFSEAFVERGQMFSQYMSAVPEAVVATKSGVSAMHDVSECGVFGALWELAEASGVGLDIDLKKIPVRQETVEICEVFDVNPYYMPSGGAMLMVTGKGHDLVRILEREGIPAQVIGKVTEGNDRIVRNEDEVRYLEPPRPEHQYDLTRIIHSNR